MKSLALTALMLFSNFGFSQSLEQDAQLNRVNNFNRFAGLNGFGQRLRQSLSQVDINVGARLFNITNDDTGVNLAARYRREVEGAGVSGLWLRSDTYTVESGINAGNFLFNMGSPLGLGIEKDTTLKFIRQFTDRSDALLSIQIDDNMKKIPVNSQVVRENLEPGDYFSTKARMNMFLGFKPSASPVAGLTTKLNAYYVLSGKFIIQTYRMAQNKIRVKIFAGESKERGVRASANIGYEFFQINPTSRFTELLVEEILDFDILELFMTREQGEILVFDYIFDLNDSDASEAYDDLMTPKLMINDARIASRVFSEQRVPTERLLSNIPRISEIVAEDENKLSKRIERGFEGQINFNNSQRGVDLSLLVLNYQSSRSYARNNIIQIEAEGNNYFYAPSYTTYRERGFDIGLIDLSSNQTSTMFSLFRNPGGGDKFEFSDIGTINKRDEFTLTAIEENSLKSDLEYNLPNESEFSKFERWGWARGLPIPFRVVKEDFNFRMQFFLNENGLIYLQQNYKTVEDFERVLTSIYQDRRGRYRNNPLFRKPQTRGATRSRNTGSLQREVKRLAEKLNEIIAIDSPLSSQEKVESVMSFRRSYVYRQYMPFLMKKLIPDPEAFRSSVYYQIEMSHAGLKRNSAINYTFGKRDTRGLYDQVRALEATFNEDDGETYILFRNSADSEYFE
ncbi:MAG: hypothetical protein CME65_02765 [Halobacteriovoraceae bacterium]|nr:hypothetical protein [Halobacteriovoraceae bacterium]|tara:strand:- start:15529 stop:17568 length:2040 start_codon:yes stop_codon:yes gene_type:complete